jgi:hypothetical protein
MTVREILRWADATNRMSGGLHRVLGEGSMGPMKLEELAAGIGARP